MDWGREMRVKKILISRGGQTQEPNFCTSLFSYVENSGRYVCFKILFIYFKGCDNLFEKCNKPQATPAVFRGLTKPSKQSVHERESLCKSQKHPGVLADFVHEREMRRMELE